MGQPATGDGLALAEHDDRPDHPDPEHELGEVQAGGFVADAFGRGGVVVERCRDPISRVSSSSASRPASTGACVVVTTLPVLDGPRTDGPGASAGARWVVPPGHDPARGWKGTDRAASPRGGGSQAAVQVAVGAVFVPVELAVKPQLALPPAGSEPLYAALRAVTASPELVTVAFQVLVRR